MNDPHLSPPGHWPRRAWIITALALGVALAGYLRGITEKPAVTRPPLRTAFSSSREAPPAVPYSELANASIRPNAGWSSRLETLRDTRPGIFDTVVRTDSLKQEALRERAARRAFDGAPPTVPHPIDQQSAASCLACHGTGWKAGNLVAVRMSHPVYANCIQCHVESNSREPSGNGTPVPNEFVGVVRAGPGERAWLGAPPVIPHPSWMREACASCHGVLGRPGLRTTHPWRTSCTQCHAPSASLDQVPFLDPQRGEQP